jgi:hypothetical protein
MKKGQIMRSMTMLKTGASALLLAGSALAGPASAQEVAAPAAQAPAAPSDSAMVNLVRLLVEQGVLSKDKGAALMAQAEAEAAKARAATATQQAQAELPAPPAGAIRVPYVPESVRAQIKNELKTEVLAQAKREGWASPDQAAPDWIKRVRLYGDLRFRSQSTLYSDKNSNIINDFARINAIGPIPVFQDAGFLPLLNTREDRWNRLQLRARLGIEAQVSKGIQIGALLATGDDNSPISTNQSLGGGFGKRDIWLQEAYIRLTPTPWAQATLGRMPNPFFTTPLLFDEDLAFDGVAAQVDSRKLTGDDFKLTLRGGAFPLDFGDPNYPQNERDKQPYPARWLFSGQAELSARIMDDITVRVGAGLHVFDNLQASLSEPCPIYQVEAQFRSGFICSTDNERATFVRKGNTLVPIRDILIDFPPPVTNEVRTSPQYLGLAFDYDVLNLTGEVKFPVSDAVGVTLTGDYVRNLAWKRSDLCRFGNLSGQYPPVNNFAPDVGNFNVCDPNPATRGRYAGGNQGFLVKLGVGHHELRKLGQWRAEVGYEYLESDAVPDAFTDSDFHLGGTNAKGYFIGARAALFDGLTLGGRWLSANEVSGEPFAIDVLQIDLEAKF